MTVQKIGIPPEVMAYAQEQINKYEERHSGHHYTPHWLVDFGKSESSSMDEFKSAVEVIHRQDRISRPSTGNIPGHFASSGALQQSNVFMVLPESHAIYEIENALYAGKPFPTVTETKLISDGALNQKAKQTVYTAVKIEILEQIESFYYIVGFRYTTIKKTFFKRDQDGAITGQVVSGFDFKKAKITSS